MSEYRYFTAQEFRGCTPRCDIEDMDEWFMSKLDVARDNAGVPFNVTSAFRTVEYEISKGRSGTSTHTKGLAVDIGYDSPEQCFKIIESLMNVGFVRIILYRSWIHVDMDKEKSQPLFLHK